MSLMDQARDLIQQITTNTDEFATPITFTDKLGTGRVCGGIAIKHNLTFDPFTNTYTSSKTTRLSMSEPGMVAAGIAVRNAANEVAMIGYKVSWKDVMGISWDYVVKKNFAGETTGSIVLLLEDFKQ